jgi:hypothetical protein
MQKSNRLCGDSTLADAAPGMRWMRARIVAGGYSRHRKAGELTDELTPSGTGMAELEKVFNNEPPSNIVDVPTRSPKLQ